MSDQITMDEWRQALSIAKGDAGQTLTEIAAATGLSPWQVKTRVQAGCNDGRFIKGVGLRTNAIGQVRQVTVYRIAAMPASKVDKIQKPDTLTPSQLITTKRKRRTK